MNNVTRAATASLMLVLGGKALAQPLGQVPTPPGNPITEPKRVLGKILFFEEQLSANNSMSCATCHVQGRGGGDPRVQIHPGLDGVAGTPDDKRASPGVPRSDSAMDFLRDPIFQTQPQVTDRATNTNINAAFSPVLFWDGRATGQFRDPVTNAVVLQTNAALESQSVNPPVSGAEMGHDGIDWTQVTSKLRDARPLELAGTLPADMTNALTGGPDYPELFRRAFGDTNISAARVAMALGTYQRTLISDQTPWDRFQAGDTTALTPQQQQGFQAFQASNCNLCHVPPLFTGNGFRNIGLRPVAEDTGLQRTTNNPADRGKFKVPTLRNSALKSTFMHNGQFNSMTAVIQFYARAPGSAPQFQDNIDPIMANVRVPPQAAGVIQDFITNGLVDPRVRDQTFPFDRAQLTAERNDRRPTSLGGGVAGTGGTVPRTIADMPGLIGTTGYRIGVDGARAGAVATLNVAFAPPVNGRITPALSLDTVTVGSSGLSVNLGTAHFALVPERFTNGVAAFFQWSIQDPSAPGGIALSTVARVPMFCGLYGCPSPCPGDFNADGFVDGFDYDDFVTCFEGTVIDCPAGRSADFTQDGFVDGFDYDEFVTAYEAGCSN